MVSNSPEASNSGSFMDSMKWWIAIAASLGTMWFVEPTFAESVPRSDTHKDNGDPAARANGSRLVVAGESIATKFAELPKEIQESLVEAAEKLFSEETSIGRTVDSLNATVPVAFQPTKQPRGGRYSYSPFNNSIIFHPATLEDRSRMLLNNFPLPAYLAHERLHALQAWRGFWSTFAYFHFNYNVLIPAEEKKGVLNKQLSMVYWTTVLGQPRKDYSKPVVNRMYQASVKEYHSGLTFRSIIRELHAYTMFSPKLSQNEIVEKLRALPNYAMHVERVDHAALERMYMATIQLIGLNYTPLQETDPRFPFVNFVEDPIPAAGIVRLSNSIGEYESLVADLAGDKGMLLEVAYHRGLARQAHAQAQVQLVANKFAETVFAAYQKHKAKIPVSAPLK